MAKQNGIIRGVIKVPNGDSPLLPESFEQIKALADYLRGISFAHAMSVRPTCPRHGPDA